MPKDLKEGLVNLQGRLHGMRDDFQRELAALIGELEAALQAADRLQSGSAGRDQRIRRLQARAEGQDNIIHTLSKEAEESHALRGTVRQRDLEIARLTRELDTKNELINALRIQVQSARDAFQRSEAGVAERPKADTRTG